MTRQLFKLPTIQPYALVRIDTDPVADTPADIRTTEGLRQIPGSLIRSGPDGDMPDVLGPDDPSVTRLYLKGESANVVLDAGQTDVGGDTATAGGSTLSGAAGRGVEIEEDGQIAVRLSDDALNALVFGTDDGLYAPIVAGGGGGGGGGAYVHHQAVASTVWTITHALGYDPGGQLVVATNGNVLDGFGVQVLTPGVQLRLSFDLAFAGTAYLS